METIQMPKWVAAFLVIATLSSLTVVFCGLTGYTLVKPFTLTISTAPSPLSVESISFAYDPALNQWTSCNLQVKNSAASPVTATVYVYLKNATDTIAQGQHTQTFPAGLTVIVVALNWLPGHKTDDVVGGYVVIQP